MPIGVSLRKISGSRRALRLCSAVARLWLSCLIAFSLISVAKAQSNQERDALDTLLRTWVTNNIYFYTDASNRETLFIRKRAVRANIVIEDSDLSSYATNAIK